MLAAAVAPVCIAPLTSIPQELVLTFAVPVLDRPTVHAEGATEVQETTVAVTCAVFAYVPINPNTNPARATAAMSVTVMSRTSDMTGETARLLV